MFFKLHSNAVAGRLYTFVFPEVAKALGRLYIDTSVQQGEQVIYKVEFVNDLGEPTGESITQEFTIDEHIPESPTNLEIENKGYRVTAEWEYPKMGNEDDKVIRFNIYSQDPETDRIRLLNEKVILRESDKREYEYEFQVNRLGKSMKYFVTAMDITGQPGPPSERITYFLKDDIPPSIVAKVKAEYIDGKVEITWPVSPETDLKGYNVYRSRDIRQDYRQLNTQLVEPLETVFRDSSIEEGNQYFYKITAVDSAGNESSKSAAAMRHIADRNPPPNPSDVNAEFSEEGTVTLSWNLSPRPTDLRRFIVLRSRMGTDNQQAFSQLTDRAFTENKFEDIGEADKGFVEGAFYRYGIVAADSSRNFSDTAFVKIQIPDLTPPEKPSFVRADNDNGIRVNVSWNATRSGDAVRYIVYRQPVDSALTTIQELPISETGFRHEDVVLGRKYRYGVSAVDSVNNESEPTFSDTVWVRDYDPPRSVRNVKVQPVESKEGYAINWEPVVAHDLAGYKVYYSNISSGVYKPLTDVQEKTTFFDSEGISGRWYQVIAIDVSGNESRPSEPVKAR
jgi:fibronectin type 3 domain-containing protein